MIFWVGAVAGLPKAAALPCFTFERNYERLLFSLFTSHKIMEMALFAALIWLQLWKPDKARENSPRQRKPEDSPSRHWASVVAFIQLLLCLERPRPRSLPASCCSSFFYAFFFPNDRKKFDLKKRNRQLCRGRLAGTQLVNRGAEQCKCVQPMGLGTQFLPDKIETNVALQTVIVHCVVCSFCSNFDWKVKNKKWFQTIFFVLNLNHSI